MTSDLSLPTNHKVPKERITFTTIDRPGQSADGHHPGGEHKNGSKIYYKGFKSISRVQSQSPVPLVSDLRSL